MRNGVQKAEKSEWNDWRIISYEVSFRGILPRTRRFFAVFYLVRDNHSFGPHQSLSCSSINSDDITYIRTQMIVIDHLIQWWIVNTKFWQTDYFRKAREHTAILTSYDIEIPRNLPCTRCSNHRTAMILVFLPCKILTVHGKIRARQEAPREAMSPWDSYLNTVHIVQLQYFTRSPIIIGQRTKTPRTRSIFAVFFILERSIPSLITTLLTLCARQVEHKINQKGVCCANCCYLIVILNKRHIFASSHLIST